MSSALCFDVCIFEVSPSLIFFLVITLARNLKVLKVFGFLLSVYHSFARDFVFQIADEQEPLVGVLLVCDGRHLCVALVALLSNRGRGPGAIAVASVHLDGAECHRGLCLWCLRVSDAFFRVLLHRLILVFFSSSSFSFFSSCSFA